MRISDWSSDVCSSDPTGATRVPPGASCAVSASTSAGAAAVTTMPSNGPFSGQPMRPSSCLLRMLKPSVRKRLRAVRRDRKSGVEGKRVAVRVGLGGRGIIQKKNLYKDDVHEKP